MSAIDNHVEFTDIISHVVLVESVFALLTHFRAFDHHEVGYDDRPPRIKNEALACLAYLFLIQAAWTTSE